MKKASSSEKPSADNKTDNTEKNDQSDEDVVTSRSQENIIADKLPVEEEHRDSEQETQEEDNQEDEENISISKNGGASTTPQEIVNIDEGSDSVEEIHPEIQYVADRVRSKR
ncbi:hypothetical protein A2U01_0052618, partial [Trifolium medium]|nr:hypothetical protein [Trifolium medium]